MNHQHPEGTGQDARYKGTLCTYRVFFVEYMRTTVSTSKLFQPMTVGRLSLSHRVVLAPMGRFHVNPVTLSPLLPLVKDYYIQRAMVPGTLLITEGTLIAAKASGIPSLPEIWTEEQISAWTEVDFLCSVRTFR